MVAQGAVAQSPLDAWAYQDRVSAKDARYSQASYLAPVPGKTNINYKSGVFLTGDSGGASGLSTHLGLRVTPGTGLQVNVAMGNCVIDTDNNGPYTCTLEEQTALTLASASPTQNRYDLVIARVYDDGNTAISSPSGVRKFTVEVWTGDGNTGTPTEPVPTPTAGWIPLARVSIGKSQSGIAATDIQDRRGPGLSARGGVKGLFGADALPSSTHFTAPGAHPGELRWNHNSGFQLQSYYGNNSDPTKAGWRGVFNCLHYTAQPVDNGRVHQAGTGNVMEICRATIADPGVPYMVFPTARAAILVSQLVAMSLRTSVGSAAGSFINFTGIDSGGAPGITQWYLNVAPMLWGPFTGSTTIVFSGQINAIGDNNQTRGWSFDGGDLDSTNGKPVNFLSVAVFPSTIQPVFA